MKKIVTIITTTFAVLALLFACTKAEERDNTPIDKPEDKPVEIVQGDGIHSLTLSSPETKTSFGDYYDDGGIIKYHKIWTEGDKINVNGHVSQELTTLDGAGTSTATFHFDDDISGATYQVVYPASAYSEGNVTIPASQMFVSGSFDKRSDIILGYGTNPADIELVNAVAYLKIRLTKGDYGNFGVTSIALNASGKKLNGTFAIADGGLGLTVPASTETAEEQTTTLVAPGTLLGASATEFLIAVAPQTLSGGFTVTITDSKSNTMEKSKASSATLAAGGILAQPELKFQEYHPIANKTDLLAFATACSAGDDNYWLITDNIDMYGETWPTAGTADDDNHSFKGTLNGGNKGDDTGFSISNLTSNTGAFVNYLNASGTIMNVTLASTCSINYSSDVESDLYMGAIAGKSHGTITGCYNYAPILCAPSSYTKPLFIGGIVGLQEHTGPVSSCVNNANITCSAASGSTNVVYIGGIAGVVVCEGSSDTAVMSHCSNHGNISRGTLDAGSSSSVHHVGGVIGWLCASNDYKHTHSYLFNDGNVTGPNYQTATNKIGQAVGGVIGGIHAVADGGLGVANLSGKVKVVIDHCTAEHCQVQNLFRNNGSQTATGNANYDVQCHNGGLIGIARGSGNVDSIELTNNTVNDVVVFSTRGFTGGLCGYSRGTTISGCNVIASQVSGAQAFRAGGITGCGYDVIIDNCTANLSKTSTLSTESQTSSLYSGNVYEVGGIAGWITSTTGDPGVTSQIKNCKAFVYHMRQKNVTEGTRGWIVGKCDGYATTIHNCSMGGTYYNGSLETITIDEDSDVTENIIRGSSSTNVTISGTNGYWNGTL